LSGQIGRLPLARAEKHHASRDHPTIVEHDTPQLSSRAREPRDRLWVPRDAMARQSFNVLSGKANAVGAQDDVLAP
jgi:hypothetical protein